MSTALQRILFQNAPADLQLDKVQRKPKNALKQLSPRQCEHADHPWIASPGWKESTHVSCQKQVKPNLSSCLNR